MQIRHILSILIAIGLSWAALLLALFALHAQTAQAATTDYVAPGGACGGVSPCY